jgi:RNA polymerase sigma-70 factor (ECF subfamily)
MIDGWTSQHGVARRCRDLPLDELLARAGAGDPCARSHLLGVVRPLAMRWGRVHLRGCDEALCSPEDIAQEVCIAVMGALPSYRPEGGSFYGFVCAIAKHKVVDAYRAGRRDRCSPMADPPEQAVDAEGPEHRVLSAERRQYFDRLLATLSSRERHVIAMRVVIGASAEETARVVGGSAGAVRVTQHRALKYLRRRLEAEAEGATSMADAVSSR